MSLDLESRQAAERKAYIYENRGQEPIVIAMCLRKKKLLDKHKSLRCHTAWVRKMLWSMHVKEFKTPSRALCLSSFGLI
jgi:hypothetical protein